MAKPLFTRRGGSNVKVNFNGSSSFKRKRKGRLPDKPFVHRDSVWWDRIDRFESDREAKRAKRKRFLRQFEHGYWGAEEEDREGVNYNLVYAWVQSILPQVLFRKPRVNVKKRPGVLEGDTKPTIQDPDVRFARALKQVLDFSYDVTQMQHENHVIVFRALLEGMAWSKDTWDLRRRMRSVQFVPADDVYVDPAAGHSLANARYLIHRIVRPAEEVYNDPLLSIPSTFEPNWTLHKELEDRMEGAPGSPRRRSQGAQDKFIRYYEIWHKPVNKDPELFVLYEEGEKRGRQDPWPFVLDQDDWPFIPLIMNSTYERVDGFSNLQAIEDYYKALNELAKYIYLRQKKSCTDKVLYDGGLDPKAIQAINNGQDLASVEIPDLAKSKNPPISVLSFPEMNEDVITGRQTMRADADEILGFSDLARGGAGQNFETATEASVARAAAQTRLDFTVRKIERFIKKQSKHGAQISQWLMDPKRLSQILGPQSINSWRYSIDPEEIQYLFRIEIETGSTRQVNRRKDIEEALALANFGARIAGAGFVDMKKLWENVLLAYEKDPQEFTREPQPQLPGQAQQVKESSKAPSAQESAEGKIVPMPEGSPSLENLSAQAAGISGRTG